MTPEIERLAKEAGLIAMDRDGRPYVTYQHGTIFEASICKLVHLVAEECAKAVINLERDHISGGDPEDACSYENCDLTAAWQDAVIAIRAKFSMPALSNGKDAAK